MRRGFTKESALYAVFCSIGASISPLADTLYGESEQNSRISGLHYKDGELQQDLDVSYESIEIEAVVDLGIVYSEKFKENSSYRLLE
jgi:hypothetical protein